MVILIEPQPFSAFQPFRQLWATQPGTEPPHLAQQFRHRAFIKWFADLQRACTIAVIR